MTTDERLETLEKELARAKRRDRRLLAVVGLAAGVLALAWIVLGAGCNAQGGKVPTVIRAGRFELVDANGEVRAYLEAAKDGATLFLFSETASATLSVREKQGPELSLLDRSGKGGEGHAMLSAGKGHAAGKGYSALLLSGGNGETYATLSANEDGTSLGLNRGTGVCSVMLSTQKGLPPGGGAPLVVYDENGKPVWWAP